MKVGVYIMASTRIQQLSKQLLNKDEQFSNIVPNTISSDINKNEEYKNILETRKKLDILDSYISYLDTGGYDKERVVIFLHGNPTSSYLWRNVIPHVQPIARCLAPDLIGMGHSGKEPNNSYRFVDHYKYLSTWIDAMNLPKKLHFVIHDWGSALGFHWCNLNPDRVGSISYLEAVVGPLFNFDSFPENYREFFQAVRSPKGEDMVLKKNLFVQQYLPSAILRKLNKEEMDNYTVPYIEVRESRRPTLTWPREIPVMSEGPEDVVSFALDWLGWLSQSEDIPKLYINVEPGLFSPQILKVVQDWPNNKIVTVRGHHFAQEDSPNEIGEAVKLFLLSL